MKRFLTLLVVIVTVFSIGTQSFADVLYESEDLNEIDRISRKFLDSYLRSVYVDESLPVDYSDFVDNENLINYMEAKKEVYRLTEKYFGEVVDYKISIFGIGTQGTYIHGEFQDAPIYLGESYFNNSEGEDVNLVGPMVFTFIEVDGELKIYGVYSLDIIDSSVRGYSRDGMGLPTIYSDLSEELDSFVADFEPKLAYYSENREQISADEVYCADLAIDYLTNYYDELYTQEETDGIFEHKLEIESGALESYLQKIAYYENSPKRYGEEASVATYDFELFRSQFWDQKMYLEVTSRVTIWNKMYPKMPLDKYSSRDYFIFVKNDAGEYVLRDLYRTPNTGESSNIPYFDLEYREIASPYFMFTDYIYAEPTVDYELLNILDEEQFAYDAELREAFENKEEREAKEAAEKEAELDKTLTELSQKDWVHEDRFPANYEPQNPELLEEENEILSNKVFIVLIVGSFAFSAVAAALSFILVLKKK